MHIISQIPSELFITKGNARFDFSFPWILTYMLSENNFCLKLNLLLLSVYTRTHTYIIMYMCIYIHTCILMTRSFRSRQNVFLVPLSFSFQLHSFITLMALERGVYIKLTNKYVKSRIIVKQKPKIKIKHKTYINKEVDENLNLSSQYSISFQNHCADPERRTPFNV